MIEGMNPIPPQNAADYDPSRKQREDAKLKEAVQQYEQVFLKLVSGGRLRVGDEIYRPIGMKGWYHAIFRRDSDGAERLLSIDQLLERMNDWI